MIYSPGDIILARFPFTDLRTKKKRPVVIVSPTEFQRRYSDVVGVALTTVEQPESHLQLLGWREAGLPKPTWIKPHVATFSSRYVDKTIGSLASSDYSKMSFALNLVWQNKLQ